jgi:uncharacterized protein YkwD
MARYAILAALLLAWPLSGPAPAQTVEEEERESQQHPAPGKAGAPDLAKVAELIVRKTNEFRKEEGRRPVTPNEKLAATAQYFSGYMARTTEYGHTADGKRPSQRVKERGYDYCIVAENIAYVYDSRGFATEQLAEKLFEGWKHSPEHRRNMLDPDVTETAVAVAHSDKNGYYYADQLFGRPKSLAIKFEIENKSGAAVGYSIGGKTFDLPPRVIRTHTRCRPGEVKFQWPGQEKPAATVNPKNGDRYAVTEENGRFAVKKE